MGKYEFFNPEDIQFEFLVTMASVEKSIIRVIEIHEEHYYKKIDISQNSNFLKEIKDLIQKGIIVGELNIIDLLDLIKRYELKIYHANKFKIFETDGSIFGIIDDLLFLVNVAIGYKDLSTIEDVNEECQYLLKTINHSWIYQDGNDSWLGINLTEIITNLNEILARNGQEELPWKNEEDLILELEAQVGKVWESFSYIDKLEAFNYLQKFSFLQGLTGKQREDLLDHFYSFLSL